MNAAAFFASGGGAGYAPAAPGTFGSLLGLAVGALLLHLGHGPLLAGVVVAMALLGLLATWIPAQRALSVNPLILLRED